MLFTWTYSTDIGSLLMPDPHLFKNGQMNLNKPYIWRWAIIITPPYIYLYMDKAIESSRLLGLRLLQETLHIKRLFTL